jgi:cell division protein FtsB
VRYRLFLVSQRDHADSTTRSAGSRRRTPTRRLVHLLILSLAAIMFIDALVGDQGVVALARVRRELARLTDGLERLKSENTVLQEQNRRLRDDPDALEETARRDLGLMKPGEKLFVIRDRTATSDTPARPTEPGTPNSPDTPERDPKDPPDPPVR